MEAALGVMGCVRKRLLLSFEPWPPTFHTMYDPTWETLHGLEEYHVDCGVIIIKAKGNHKYVP